MVLGDGGSSGSVAAVDRKVMLSTVIPQTAQAAINLLEASRNTVTNDEKDQFHREHRKRAFREEDLHEVHGDNYNAFLRALL